MPDAVADPSLPVSQEEAPGGRARLVGLLGLGEPSSCRLPRDLLTVFRVGIAVFGLQFAGLALYSYHIWRRFDLGIDFAIFAQAWSRIGSGHLDPYATMFPYGYPHYGYPFWQSHFELIMWPIALLHPIWHSSLLLLFLQDLAISGASLVTLRWGLEWLDIYWAGPRVSRVVLGAGLLAVLAINPWTYWTASVNFHFQPLATLLTVLAARDIWLGRNRAWIWIITALLCGDVAATYVVALGIATLLLGRDKRRFGIVLVALGLLWLAVIGTLDADKASSLAANYGYLAGRRVGNGLSGVLAILGGLAVHPFRAWHVVWPRRHEVGKYIGAAGTVGVASFVGLPMALVVLSPSVLNASLVFIGPAAAFQSLIVVFLTALGGLAVLTWLSRKGTRPRYVAMGLAVAMLAQAALVSYDWTSKAPSLVLKTPAPAAAELAALDRKIPAGAEVVVSEQVIGRFADRPLVYPVLVAEIPAGQVVPVRSTTVVFVVLVAGADPTTVARTVLAEQKITGTLHALPFGSRSGVAAYIWHPPPHQADVRID